jgi:hypothetical protein
MQNIIKTANGYRATIDGMVWDIPDDPNNRFRKAVQDAIDAGASVADAPLTALPVPQEVTFAQLLIGLVTEGWITEAQGDDWLAGKLPLPVVALIGALPEDRRFAAKARAARPSVVLRADPLVNALAAARGLTAEQLDAFFATYSRV